MTWDIWDILGYFGIFGICWDILGYLGYIGKCWDMLEYVMLVCETPIFIQILGHEHGVDFYKYLNILRCRYSGIDPSKPRPQSRHTPLSI